MEPAMTGRAVRACAITTGSREIVDGDRSNTNRSNSPDQLVDESERVGVLQKRPDLCAVKARGTSASISSLSGNVAAWDRRQLLDDRLDDLVNVAGRPCPARS